MQQCWIIVVGAGGEDNTENTSYWARTRLPHMIVQEPLCIRDFVSRLFCLDSFDSLYDLMINFTFIGTNQLIPNTLSVRSAVASVSSLVHFFLSVTLRGAKASIYLSISMYPPGSAQQNQSSVLFIWNF